MVYIEPIEHMIANSIFPSAHAIKTTQNPELIAILLPVSIVVRAIQLDSIPRCEDFLPNTHLAWVVPPEKLRQALHERILPSIVETKEVHQAQFLLEQKEIINTVQIILL